MSDLRCGNKDCGVEFSLHCLPCDQSAYAAELTALKARCEELEHQRNVEWKLKDEYFEKWQSAIKERDEARAEAIRAGNDYSTTRDVLDQEREIRFSIQEKLASREKEVERARIAVKQMHKWKCEYPTECSLHDCIFVVWEKEAFLDESGRK